ncbi:carboxypeptidase regulatory-like domain-containing protein [Flavobacterium sp. CHNK8]|uniref:TonB-dependent receptor n=1 Tax=Flavobacterium sp. CHNK8 TaxID=2871165 RepID=UPI001C8F08DE|nr:carboxypeptidase regulatory-like domain-containing protein [Flavobacterium sp. CHNK8]QZK90139.1 carboxypeptidase regulatory-like domain-containing protein [Flavobacterium sp. CHNK8]
MKYIFTFLILFCSGLLFAQETTGIVKGTITDEQNNTLPFATISILQKSTGIKYATQSQADGYYEFNQLQPAYDYEIKIVAEGFNTLLSDAIQVQLGKTTKLDFILFAKAEVLQSVVVVNNAESKKGNEKRLKIDVITNLPSANRSIQDATRLLPEANLNSFGGANYRFNNLSIDGSATNDVLGFQEPASGAAGSTASGTPGGLAGTQPIGFGAISALSVKTAPFDVTFGNFTGASINAVTKSGTNKTTGLAYTFVKNRNLVGTYADGIKKQKAAFNDYTYGFSIGGSLVKNKLFYFFNAELADRNETVFNAPGSITSNISAETVALIADRLKTKYNYDPGTALNAQIERKNTKLFLRLDYNISDDHKLTLRNNFVKGYADNLEWTPTVFNFTNQGYRHNSTTNSIVAELKSKFTNQLSNKMTVSLSTVNDDRTYEGRVFPHLEIIDNTSNTVFAGTYREASIYGLSLNTIQFTDNLTYYHRNHKFTAGVSSEINSIEYRFLTAFNGRWQYNSVASFLADQPNRVRGVYNIENNDFEFNKKTPSADYGVVLGSAYLQDEIRLSKKFTILAGIRLDWQNTPTAFPVSDEIQRTPEFAGYQNKINSSPIINPRFGFNYTIDKDGKYILKGGSGLFTGRMPFVWYAYEYYISGTKYFNIDYRPTTNLDINEDLSQLAPLQNRKLTEVNLVDTNFNLPRDWKSNIALDVALKNNFALNLEATYTKTLEGLLFQSINRREDQKSNFTGADQRPYYNTSAESIKINPNFTNVFLLTNTSKGYRYNFTLGLTKTESNYNGFLGYTYGVSKDISSTNRNSHAANFEWNQALVANSPELTASNFDLRHKIVSYHFYDIHFKSSSFKVGLLYNGRSGSPFTFVYEGDINRDGSAKNDIIYIPRDQSEIRLQNIVDRNNTIIVSAAEQWQQLNEYINDNDYLSKNRGKYANRNAARTPWNHQVDLKLMYETKLFKNKVEFALDLFNVGNLVSKNWGTQVYVPNINNSGYALLDFVRIENQQPVFQFKNPKGTPWLVDNLNSRWQGQLSVSYHFL